MDHPRINDPIAPTMEHTFSRTERLRKQSLISKLLKEGKTFTLFPFRVSWIVHPTNEKTPVQVLISVPKHNFPNAVHRNRIRRLIRESYRLNKQIAVNPLTARNQGLLLHIHYTSKEILPFRIVQEKIILLLQRLRREHEKVAG